MKETSRKGVIFLLFTGVLMGALDISIVGPALPSIENSLHIGPRFSGWIFSIYVLFNLSGISLFARLSDVYGRRKIYVLALSVFAIGSLWVSLARDFNFLLIGRAIQGFGASGIFPVASAVVGDLFPPERRGRILGLIGAVFGIAFMIGPFMAGVLLHYFAWNFLFIINLPISVLLIFYSFRLLPSIPNKAINQFDWPGIFTLGISLAAFTFGINNIEVSGNSIGIFNTRVMIPFAISIISAFALLIVERQEKNPIIEFSFFKNSQIIIVGIIAAVTGIVQACFVFIPKFVVQNFSVSPSSASFMLTPFVLATAIGSPVFGRLIDKYGVKKIIMTGIILCSAGFFVLSVTGDQKSVYYLSGTLIGLGLSVLAGSSLRYIMLNNTTAEDRAVSQGMLTIFISIGQLAGTAIIGIILASLSGSHGYETIFKGIAIILFMMLLLSLRIKNR
jgi:MFS family permease